MPPLFRHPQSPVMAQESPLRERIDGERAKWHYIHRNALESTMESRITVKGQFTIPKAIREHLRLKPGDHVKFFIHPDGTVVLLPKLPVSTLRGMLKPQPRRPAEGESKNQKLKT
ncbi:MAG TPA: type II toxin-antitoxin system PrlF family antitoxin [Candidatus Bathyarchaeia archaeon]|nr:type II toxin-antitoxin system PrlF family antitoxin [Candidatus Bathyarchaeia archaeon]